MSRKLRPRAALAALLVILTCGIAAASANAASDVYFEGFTSSWLATSTHTLNETSIRLLSGPIGCTGARNTDFSSAGIDACTTALGGAIAHPFGNVLRYAWCGTPVGYGASNLRCRQDY